MTDRRRRLRRDRYRDIGPEPRDGDRRHTERRGSERVAAEILVEVETSGRRTYRRTANISMGGIGFHAPIPFRVGSKVHMSIRPARTGNSIRVQGEVIGADEAGRGNRVRFVDLSAEVRKALQEHLRLYSEPTRVGVVPPVLADRTDPSQGRVREGVLIAEKDPTGREIRLRSTDRIVGRDPHEADIVVDHPTVSRRHAIISLENGRHVVSDLSSTNGIHFRGQAVRSLLLRDGMVFYIGSVRMQYLVTKAI